MEYKKKLYQLYQTGALHITIGTFLTKFVAFFGSIFVVRILSKEQYGYLGYVENIYSYALIFAGLGLSFVSLRYIIIAEEKKKYSYYQYVISHSIFRNFAIMLFIIIGNFFIKYPPEYECIRKFIPIVALLLPVQDMMNDSLYSMRSMFKNKQFAYWSIGISVSLILGRVLGANFAGVGGVLWSRVIINGGFAVLLLLYCRTLFIKEDTIPLERSEIVEANKYGFQYMLTNGLWAIFMLNDVFILGLLVKDATIVADYKVAYVLPGNISILATAIGTFVGPYFTKNEKDFSWIRKNFITTGVITFGLVAVASGLLMIFAKPLIIFMYGKDYLNIVPIMRMLLVAAVLNSGIRYTIANILSAMGMVKYNLIISFWGIILQVLLDIILITQYGVVGVAISSCIVFGVMAVCLFGVVIKKFYIVK